MKKNNQPILSRIGKVIKHLFKYFWEIAFSFFGIYSLVNLLEKQIFEYSISFSELDFSELIFLIAFIRLTINYYRAAKLWKTGIFKNIEIYFLPQGLLFLFGNFIIRHNILMITSYLDEPVLKIACFLLILVGIGISIVSIQKIKLALPAPKKVKSDKSQESLQ